MNTEEMIREGEKAMQEGNPGASLAIFNSILERNPNNITAAYYLAQCLNILGRFEEALTQYNNLLKKVDPNSDNGADILASKGETLIELNDLQGADACFDHALQIKPRISKIWIEKARVAARRGNYNQSLEYCDSALALDPKGYRAWNNKAYALLKLNRYDECITCARKALSLWPDYVIPWAWLAKAYEKKGKSRKARQCVEELKRRQTDDSTVIVEHTVGHKRGDISPQKISKKEDKPEKWKHFLRFRTRKVQELLSASQRGDIPRVRTLLKKKVEANSEYGGWTALGVAAWAGNSNVLQLLLDEGADPNLMTREMGPALTLASSEGHKEVVDVLLATGANVDAKDKKGCTALIRAANNGHSHIVEVLLAAGSNVNEKSNEGVTALSLAAWSGGLEVIKLLLSKGANVNAKGINGETALMVAASAGQLEVVKALIAGGVDINAKDNDGRTAQDIASLKGHNRIANALKRAF
ncbi:MAG: ankyrin repeat domain-containing protein [Planctomycetota bacterium]|jgi:tetratricopeptide (TPR) repeat protein